jgi:DNA-binding beta-propeller fold protein YncE
MMVLGAAIALAGLATDVQVSWAAPGDLRHRDCAGEPIESLPCPGQVPSIREIVDLEASADGRTITLLSDRHDATVVLSVGTGGAIEFASCVVSANRATADAVSACAPTSIRLSYLHSVAIAPDGRDAYVATEDYGAILLHFSRDPLTGELSYEDCMSFRDVEECSQSLLGAPRELEFSPDGRFLYATGGGLTWFARAADGELTPAGCIQTEAGAGGGCVGVPTDALTTSSMAFSPDGRSLYLTSGSLKWFSRDPADGSLAYGGCIDGINAIGGGSAYCPIDVPGIAGPTDGVVSPDGRHLYVSARWDNAVATFERGPGGEPVYASCIEDLAQHLSRYEDEAACPRYASGLDTPVAIAASPSGGDVYVGGSTFTHLDRDASSGMLTVRSCSTDLLSDPSECTVGPDTGTRIHEVEAPPTGDLVFAAEGGERASSYRVEKASTIGPPDPADPVPPIEPDRSRCRGIEATIVVGPGAARVVGTPGDDVIVASGGHRILGRGGEDLICGGSAADRIDAGPGADRVFGGGGRDRLQGGPGSDSLHGGAGSDRLLGGSGRRDRCAGGSPQRDERRSARADVALAGCEQVEGAVER